MQNIQRSPAPCAGPRSERTHVRGYCPRQRQCHVSATKPRKPCLGIARGVHTGDDDHSLTHDPVVDTVRKAFQKSPTSAAVYDRVGLWQRDNR
jgi:hypothetical protein